MKTKSDKEVTISLIIPIYNTEKFVERCLCSVFGQTWENVEYILINDCTPDKSIKVAERVIKQYPDRKVSIVNNQKNIGSAGVRNIGIKMAKGEYIIFIDSDDYVEPAMLEDMYHKAKVSNADIVIADYYVNYPQKQIYKKQIAPDTGVECAKWILSGRLHSSNSNKLIKRELYLNNNISFIEGINMWEDMSTITRICFFANKVAYLPKAYLHYVQYNENSYTANLTDKSLMDMQTVITILQSFFYDKEEFKKVVSFLRLQVKANFLIHSKGDTRKKACQLYDEPWEIMLEHPSLSFFNKLLLLSEKCKLLFLIDIFSWIYHTRKKRILRASNKERCL